jgi:putative transposase
MAGVAQLAPLVGVLSACAALGLPRSSFYRRQRPPLGPKPRPLSSRALTPDERATALSCLHEDRFLDRAPAAVYATLLDEGRDHCSIRTIYRLLEQKGETRERRDQLTHPPYQKPELLATAPKNA